MAPTYESVLSKWKDENRNKYSKESFGSILLQSFRRLTRWKHFYKLVLAICVLYFFYFKFGSNMLAIVFSVIAVLCFYPMAKYDFLGMEFGFSAMIISSSIYGFATGLIVGKIPNLIGHLLTLQLDYDLIYEFIIYTPIAYIAAFFPLEMIPLVGSVITIIYNAGYVLYFRYSGILTPNQFFYALSNAIFNIIVMVNIVPVLKVMGF